MTQIAKTAFRSEKPFLLTFPGEGCMVMVAGVRSASDAVHSIRSRNRREAKSTTTSDTVHTRRNLVRW